MNSDRLRLIPGSPARPAQAPVKVDIFDVTEVGLVEYLAFDPHGLQSASPIQAGSRANPADFLGWVEGGSIRRQFATVLCPADPVNGVASGVNNTNRAGPK